MDIIVLMNMCLLIFCYDCLTNKFAMLHYVWRAHQILEQALKLCQNIIVWLEDL